jgi:hypothetical protein
MVSCGDVIWLYDATAARDAKTRMFVCLDPEQGWCARIVTRRPRHHPVLIRKSDHPFLDHDSYVETGMPVEFLDDDLATAGCAGRISGAVARSIVEAWQRSDVTPEEARDSVILRLKLEFGIP